MSDASYRKSLSIFLVTNIYLLFCVSYPAFSQCPDNSHIIENHFSDPDHHPENKKSKTSTLTAKGTVVPWLAANGELAYTPESPPKDIALFFYNRFMPHAFHDPKSDRWWGGDLRSPHETQDFQNPIQDFWNSAIAGKVNRILIREGERGPTKIVAPIAIYQDLQPVYKHREFIIIQNGSYQFVGKEQQPEIEKGLVWLYKGLYSRSVYSHKTIKQAKASQPPKAIQVYFERLFNDFSDSAVVFPKANIKYRQESRHLNSPDRLWSKDEKLEYQIREIEKAAVQMSFSLSERLSARKFGPHYVVLRVPIDNLRITSNFVGEDEVNFLDPARVEVVKCIGCRIETSELTF